MGARRTFATAKGAGSRLPAEDRQAIVGLLKGGKSAHAVAQATGRSKSAIAAIARAEGLTSATTAPAAATAARVTRAEAAALFAETRQLTVLSRLADAVQARLDAADERPLTPLEMQQTATAFAILIDKWRLIEGEATQRTEVAAVGARERLAARLDELAARRRLAPGKATGGRA